MTLRLPIPRAWRRLPRRTIRLRLTVLYGALFVATGAALLTVTYVLVEHQYTKNGAALFISCEGTIGGSSSTTSGGALSIGSSSGGGISSGTVVAVWRACALPISTGGRPLPLPTAAQATQIQATARAHSQAAKILATAQAHSQTALHQLLIDSGIALAIMAVISIWLGWLVAGRALRPLRTITNAAREISASSLHRRLALGGPDDEIAQLGNTFDELLERLEASFEAQRQFVANASHELRTPLTLERTLVEVALADPDASTEALRETLGRVLAAGEQQERLIEALLTLSRSQRGLDRREPVDLAAATELGLRALDADGLTVTADLQPAWMSGDRRLAERLVANLLANAARHNLPGGQIDVRTGTEGGRALVAIANSGRPIPAGELERLFQPFQRLERERANGPDGLGLGLSIVQAIAAAHHAALAATPCTGGGLLIEVAFATAAPAAARKPPPQRPAPSVNGHVLG